MHVVRSHRSTRAPTRNGTHDRPHRGIDQASTTQGLEDARAIDPREAQREAQSVGNVVASQAPGATALTPQSFPILKAVPLPAAM
jgi:hypothetical protein